MSACQRSHSLNFALHCLIDIWALANEKCLGKKEQKKKKKKR
jgi:hypothetical protein